MRRRPYGATNPPPPSFTEARNLRQRTRAAGLDPNYWYPVCLESGLKPGETRKVRFWGRGVAVWRGNDGLYRAIEDRCAHRQLPLSEGIVVENRLVCQYHGWGYEGDGRCTSIPHETFGKTNLNIRVEGFPVAVRYGLVWVFFGEPEQSEKVPLPSLPDLEGSDPWTAIPLEYLWRAHHSMVLDNVSDYTHGYLHRKLEPFRDPKLIHVKTEGDKVHVRYDTLIAAGKWMAPFVHRNELGSNTIDLEYDYPYSRSNTDDHIKHFIAVLPEDAGTSRVFVVVCYKALKLPGLPVSVPRSLMKWVVRFGNRFIVDPVFSEDGWAVELEQKAWEAEWDAPPIDLNPQVKAFQDLTVRKWEEYLRRSGQIADTTEAS